LLALGVEIAGALVELGLLERLTAAGLGLVDVAVGLADLATMLVGIGDVDEVIEVAERVAAGLRLPGRDADLEREQRIAGDVQIGLSVLHRGPGPVALGAEILGLQREGLGDQRLFLGAPRGALEGLQL